MSTVVAAKVVYSAQKHRCFKGCNTFDYFLHDADEDPITGSWKCANRRCPVVYPFRLYAIRRRQTKAITAGSRVELLVDLTQIRHTTTVDVKKGEQGIVKKLEFGEMPGVVELDVLWDNTLFTRVNSFKVNVL